MVTSCGPPAGRPAWMPRARSGPASRPGDESSTSPWIRSSSAFNVAAVRFSRSVRSRWLSGIEAREVTGQGAVEAVDVATQAVVHQVPTFWLTSCWMVPRKRSARSITRGRKIRAGEPSRIATQPSAMPMRGAEDARGSSYVAACVRERRARSRTLTSPTGIAAKNQIDGDAEHDARDPEDERDERQRASCDRRCRRRCGSMGSRAPAPERSRRPEIRVGSRPGATWSAMHLGHPKPSLPPCSSAPPKTP